MYYYKAEVTRIIDGDTIDVTIDLGFSVATKARLRLYGINTPESRTRDKAEKKRGKAATARLQELIAKNKGWVYMQSREKGKYGRYLAEIYIPASNGVEKDEDGKDYFIAYDFAKGMEKDFVSFEDNPCVCINYLLVKEEHAVPYFGGKRG